MIRNLTLSADEQLIRRARERAKEQRTSLNAVFRRWLESYAGGDRAGEEYDALMKSLEHVQPGRGFSREEMNER